MTCTLFDITWFVSDLRCYLLGLWQHLSNWFG